MRVTTGHRNPQELTEAGGAGLALHDSAGNIWRITEVAPGELHLSLAGTPTGDTGMVVEPRTSNLVALRNRPLEWTVGPVT